MIWLIHSIYTAGRHKIYPMASQTPSAIAVPTSYGGVPTTLGQAEGIDVVRSEPVKSETEYYCSDSDICKWTTVFLGLIVLCATLPTSFHYVYYDQYALLRDVYGTVRLSKVYEQGRYFYPLNYDTIYFPANYIGLDFDVVVFTDTGLEFSVEFGFYYRLPRENVGRIYDSFSKNYHDLVKTNAKTTIKNVAADLTINSYLNDRAGVERVFAEAVHDVLEKAVLVDAPVHLFKMGEIKLPDSIVETSLESAIAIQNNEILQNTQEVVLIRAETARLVAEIDAETTTTLEFAANEATRLIEESNSFANQVTIRARGTGIQTLIDSLALPTSNRTSDIIKKLALLDNAGNATIVDAAISSIEIDAQ